MKILITGSSGFVSKKIINFLQKKKNFKIHVISRKIKKNKKNLFFYNLNLLKHDKIKSNSFDIVFHTAAIVANKKNINDLNLLKKNIKMTSNLINILKGIKFKKIINFSSSSVYSNNSGVFSEKSPINPIYNNDFIYGLSKFSSEVLFKCNFQEKKVLNLRIAQIYGEGMVKTKIMPSMINSIKKGNKISIFGDGSRLINFIEINDLIKYIFKLIKKKSHGVYNISSITISTNQLAAEIIRKYGNKNSKILYVKSKKNNQKFILDTKKLNKSLNIKKKLRINLL